MKHGQVTNNNEAADIANLYQKAAAENYSAGYVASASVRYRAAADWWTLAGQLSIGHNRTDRYEGLAEYCRERAEGCKRG